MKVVISGAGIAGQTVAFWLARAGWECVLVERFPSLRTGGQNVDIRGVAREVIDRMGLAGAVDSHGTGEVGTRFVNARDESIAAFPQDGTDGGTAEWEILRGQLSHLLFEATTGAVSYRFDTVITAVQQDRDSLRIAFEDGLTEQADAMVVAEGIGSRTRGLLAPRFGTIQQRHLGIAVGYFSIPRTSGDDDWWRWYNARGGRSATLRPDNIGRQRATLSFRTGPLGSGDGEPADAAGLLREKFAGAGWETKRILAGLDSADDLYLDDVGQIHAERWVAGRIALVGDAAYCPSPVTGMGTSLAITGAYILAQELLAAAEPSAGLRHYEQVLRPYVTRAQKLPPGAPGVMHPRSRAGVALLRTAFRLAGSGLLRPIERRLFHPPADEFELPDYPKATVG